MKRKNSTYGWLMLAGLALTMSAGCKPQTTTQKIEDKAEDAGHEMEQGMERAKENIQDKK